VNTLNGKFDPDRFLCLIGTNPKDYLVARGWSSRVVGPFSDGLVRINNAVVFGPAKGQTTPRLAARAYLHRSHSGYFGIVNSEEGYQNLTRFLFGNVRVDGYLEVRSLSLPPKVEQAQKKGKEIRASYHFESITRVRGANWDLSRRVAAENSTVFRKFGELFPDKARPGDRQGHNQPQLFTAFLRKGAKVVARRPSLGFSVDLGILVPNYEIAGALWMDDHYEGGYLFREKINLEAIPPHGDERFWTVRYGIDSKTPNRATLVAERVIADGYYEFRIPIQQKSRPGVDATLILIAYDWNESANG
jgi:hypothetical protein